MRNSRDRWTFFQHASKPVISASDVLYWKNTLKKILKVGMEFEFNLPDQKGTCKGDSQTCPCMRMTTDNCWKACANLKTCTSNANIHRCDNRTEDCKPEDCGIKCNNYKLVCYQMYCPNFVSACFTCSQFASNCTKCPDRFDPERNPNEIRNMLTRELAPSNCYGIVSGCGIHSITKDGSLLGDKGVEVITVGRRVDYWEFFRMGKQIIDAAVARGAYMNERCSTHMHILASYYGKLPNEPQMNGIPSNISEMEKEMPEIILANFHQLCRRYQNAMTWMTMALDEPERMTRWEKFRVSILDISAILNQMRSVKDTVSHTSGGNKYGWVNYNNCQFNGKDVKRFHVEMRVADGMLAPSAVAALACLYYALMIKAVEISKYGVLEVGDDEWMQQAKKIKEAILNNMKDYNAGDRFGDTRNLPKYYDILRGESYDLVRQLKHILIKIGPSYNVLEKLAERPIALRRCDGESWEEIEKDLEIPMTNESQFETKVSEFIDLRLIDECHSMEEWIAAIGQALREDPDFNDHAAEDLDERVNLYIDRRRNEGELIWSESLGTVVFI